MHVSRRLSFGVRTKSSQKLNSMTALMDPCEPGIVGSAQRRAQDFWKLVQHAKRGRLKVYLGFAAGVGKTYRMLEEARALKERKVDVVIGFVGTHDRVEQPPCSKALRSCLVNASSIAVWSSRRSSGRSDCTTP